MELRGEMDLQNLQAFHNPEGFEDLKKNIPEDYSDRRLLWRMTS